MRKKTINCLILLAVILLTGCNNAVVYQDNISLKKDWHKDSVITFNANIPDTAGHFNVLIELRNSGAYPYQNIWLFINSISPDSVSLTDTLEFYMADNTGKWLGKGFGSNHNMDLLYMHDIQFPTAGTYRFSIQHAMRDTWLKGITGVGLRIEEIE